MSVNIKPRHIVEALIFERAPDVIHSVFWPVIRPILYGLLGYRQAVDMADAIAGLSGPKAMDYVDDLLDLKLEISHLERVPEKGRCVIICNHPTGIADGVAVYRALKQRRPDLIFFANADALRVCAGLAQSLIPVEWVEAKRTRQKARDTLLAAKAAFESERCIVLFPAGRLARCGADGVLRDPPWAPTAISLAQKYQAPIIPLHISGPNSFWFHSFDKVSTQLRDITLFLELLNKARKRFELRFGPVVSGARLERDDANEALKTFIERDLATDKESLFEPC